VNDEEIAELKARLAESVNQPPRVIPAAHPTPDEVRTLLRECVTTVGPGEMLVIRVPYDTPREEANAYQQILDAAREAWGIRAVVVVAEGLGVIPEAGDEAFDKRVMAAINRLDVRADVRGGSGVPVHAEPGCAWVGGEAGADLPALIAPAPYKRLFDLQLQARDLGRDIISCGSGWRGSHYGAVTATYPEGSRIARCDSWRCHHEHPDNLSALECALGEVRRLASGGSYEPCSAGPDCQDEECRRDWARLAKGACGCGNDSTDT
jgi:hypothetical protein